MNRPTGLRVAILANTKPNVPIAAEGPDDALAEYDSLHTVQAIADALAAAGHRPLILEADETLLDTIRIARPDICFNIAEGLRGEARESHVPALLEMLGIPYTGGNVLTHALSLNKGMTKQVWRAAGLPTAPFQVFRSEDEPLHEELKFPLFVKPVREGSGMGINGHSIVHNRSELEEQVAWVLATYRQPALVEVYLPGREFTVGLIGNRRYGQPATANAFYNAWGYHVFPVLEVDATQGAGQGLYNALAKSFLPGEEGAPAYHCPAPIAPALAEALQRLAILAFEAVGGLDCGRVDFRLDAAGHPYLLEVNTLPGLNPLASDMCIVARAEGVAYETLIQEILHLAIARYECHGHQRLPQL
jgi:D-alanine-D-alanine ligase